jgi:flagellar hook-associated protein 3 FlgL
MIRVSTANMFQNSQQGINADQSALMTSVAQLSSGKQVNSPADNPVGAAQASFLQSDITQLGQYSSNQAQATQLLNNGSSTVTQAINVMQSVRTSLVQAGNGTLSDSDRSALAAQLQQNLNQLVGLANTSDGQGGYLFGGSVNSSPPFVQSGNNVSYVGDNIVQGLQISQTRTEQVTYSGSAVFMAVPSGNGTFVTAAGGSNTGRTSYKVVDNKTGSTVVAAGTAYSNPTTVSFDGMQMSLSGAPAAGDTFTVAPAGTQSIFSNIASAIAALQSPTTTAAATAQRTAAVTNALGGADQAITSLSTTQASMGAQLSELNTYGTINGDQTLQDQTQMSSIVDLDYAKGVSQLTQQQTQYQAALQSYSAVSKLSLFNYL